MKTKQLFLLFFLLTLSASSFAQTSAWCGLGYRADSFAYGAKSVITGSKELPESDWLDNICFRLGERYAATLSSSSCLRNFDKNTDLALNLKPLISSGNSTCSLLGHQYGRAVISNDARLGNPSRIGQECVDRYRAGKRNGTRRLARNGRPNDWCYESGYFDGVQFQGLL